MLQELSYRKKIPSVDILTMECVASCNTTITKSDPKTTIGQLSAMFKNIALPKGYGITRESLKSLYDHSFDGDIDFAALSVITDILSKGIILSHWADAHTIVDKTSVIAAPIEINNERYYAVLISGKKKSEFKYPYVMRVFSDAYIKDELLNIYRTSPQGVTTSRQNADFQKFAANLLINYILNNSDLSFLTTNSANTQNNDNNQQPINCNRNMNKKLIRLTESDLHRIVKESVNRILKEEELKGTLLNPSPDSLEKKQAYRLYDEIERKLMEIGLVSDSHHHPAGFILQDAVLEMIRKNDYRNLRNYAMKWKRMLETNNFDTWS